MLAPERTNGHDEESKHSMRTAVKIFVVILGCFIGATMIVAGRHLAERHRVEQIYAKSNTVPPEGEYYSNTQFWGEVVLIWNPLVLALALLAWAAASARSLVQVLGAGIAAGLTLFTVFVVVAGLWFLTAAFAPGGDPHPEDWTLAKRIGFVGLGVLIVYFPVALIRWGRRKAKES